MDLLDEFQQHVHGFDGRPATPDLLPAIDGQNDEDEDWLAAADADADGANAALAALGRYTQPLLLDASVRPGARGRGQVVAAASGGGTLALATARGYVEWYRWDGGGDGGGEERCADVEVVVAPSSGASSPASSQQQQQQARVQRLFVDPTGTHLLALVRHGGAGAAAGGNGASSSSSSQQQPPAPAPANNCELYYARRGWQRAKPLAKARGHAVSAVAWPPLSLIGSAGGADSKSSSRSSTSKNTTTVEEAVTGVLVGTEAGSLHLLSLAVRTPAALLQQQQQQQASVSAASAAATAAATTAASVDATAWRELLRVGDRHAACICSAEQIELPRVSPPPSSSSPANRRPPSGPRLAVFVCTPRALYAAVGGPGLEGVFEHLAAPGGEVAWDPVIQASVASLHSYLVLHSPRRFHFPSLGAGGGAAVAGATTTAATAARAAPALSSSSSSTLLPTRFTWLVGGVLCHGHLQLPRLAADEGAVGAEGAAEAFCEPRQLALALGGGGGGGGDGGRSSATTTTTSYLPGGVYMGGAVAAAGAAAAAAAAAAAGGAGVAGAAAAAELAGGDNNEQAAATTPAAAAQDQDRRRALLGGLAVPMSAAAAAAAAASANNAATTTPPAAGPSAPEHEPLALAVTEHHYLLLHADRLVAVNQVSGRPVAEARPLTAAPPLCLLRDPCGGGRGGGAAAATPPEGDAPGTQGPLPTDAARPGAFPGVGWRPWRVYAAAGDHETALRLAVGAAQRDAVRLAAASAAYSRGDFASAAAHWGRVVSSEPRFEDLALRLVDTGDAEALAIFLAARMEGLDLRPGGGEDRAQGAMLGAWLTELYLDAANREAAEGAAAATARRAAAGMVAGLEQQQEEEQQERPPERAGEAQLLPASAAPPPPQPAARRLRAFLERRSDVLDPATTAALLAGYGRADDLAAFCAARGDHEALLELLLAAAGAADRGGGGGGEQQQQQAAVASAARALAVLRDPRVPQELTYRFAPALVAAAPREAVDAWIAARPPLDPRRLLPALVRFGGEGGAAEAGGGASAASDPRSAGSGDDLARQHVLRYLLHATDVLGCEDEAVHNLAVALLAAQPLPSVSGVVAVGVGGGVGAASSPQDDDGGDQGGGDISPPGTPKGGGGRADAADSPSRSSPAQGGRRHATAAPSPPPLAAAAAAAAAERPLLEFLRRARCRRTGRPLYDPRYALRVARERGRTRATVRLLCELGLYDDAVALALASGGGGPAAVALAKAAASAPPADDAPLRRRLWLSIARHVVSSPADGGGALDTEEAQAERVARAAELVREASEAGAGTAAATGDLLLLGGGGGGGGGGGNGGFASSAPFSAAAGGDEADVLATAAAAASTTAPAAPPPPLTVEDLLPLFPAFAAIGAFRAPISDALARYSRQIGALRREMDEAAEIAGRARRDLAALSGGRAAVLPAGAPCAKCGRPAAAAPAPNAGGLAPLSAGRGAAAVARLFYVFPTGLAWHALCAAEEVCALGGERRARRVAGLVARLAGALAPAAGGGARAGGGEDAAAALASSSSARERERDRERGRLAADLADEVAGEDPWNGDLVAAMADKPFVERGEAEEKAWALL